MFVLYLHFKMVLFYHLKCLFYDCACIILGSTISAAKIFSLLMIRWNAGTIGWNIASPKGMQNKRNFPLRISLVNVTKSTGNWGFGHIY